MEYIDVISEKDLAPILRFKTWDNVISLGGTCQVAFQLKRLELRKESMPFDWVFLTEPMRTFKFRSGNELASSCWIS